MAAKMQLQGSMVALVTPFRTGQVDYDALGRLTETRYPDGARTTTNYDAAGQVIASTDALGQMTRYEYDAAGRRTSVKQSGQAFTFAAASNAWDLAAFNKYAYNSRSELTSAQCYWGTDLATAR